MFFLPAEQVMPITELRLDLAHSPIMACGYGSQKVGVVSCINGFIVVHDKVTITTRVLLVLCRNIDR
jgi:hypothetical protein